MSGISVSRLQMLRDEARIEFVLHWLWSSQLQIKRIGENMKRDWSDSGPEPFERVASQNRFDEHMFLVAARNMLRALDRIPRKLLSFTMPDDMMDSITLLRDVYEHWNAEREPYRRGTPKRGGSVERFLARYPSGKPWAIEYTADGPCLASVLSLKRFAELVAILQEALLRVQTSVRGSETRGR